jgi:hypothetical protein
LLLHGVGQSVSEGLSDAARTAPLHVVADRNSPSVSRIRSVRKQIVIPARDTLLLCVRSLWNAPQPQPDVRQCRWHTAQGQICRALRYFDVMARLLSGLALVMQGHSDSRTDFL